MWLIISPLKKENRMNKKTIVFIVFIILAAIQLYIPAKMIIDKENTLETGKSYKFKTEPIDPNDPFRGKYITLNFEETRVKVKSWKDWEDGETVYVTLYDSAGYTKPKSIHKEKPGGDSDFIKVKIKYIIRDKDNEVILEYPFDRYYMEESKAFEAEQVYRETQIDTAQKAYALVMVKDGNAVLKDVMINEIPIKEVVKQRRKP